MKLLVINASHKVQSESSKTVKLVQQLSADFSEVKIHEIKQMGIPFWDEGIWENTDEWKRKLAPIRQEANEADAYVFVVPEYNGMVPPFLKNYFLVMDSSSMAHKPALIVAVSSGFGGSYPIMELRTSGYKNTKVCFIPEHIIIRHAPAVLDNITAEENKKLVERTRFCMTLLNHYARCMQPIRQLELPFAAYPYGM